MQLKYFLVDNWTYNKNTQDDFCHIITEFGKIIFLFLSSDYDDMFFSKEMKKLQIS